jgi:predicted ATPase
VLVVCADPCTAEYPALSHVEEEISAIQKTLSSQRGAAVVEVIRHAAPAALRARLKEFAPHVLHYIGHGSERATGGALALHSGSGVEELYGADLAGWIMQSSTRLVVLSACQTASSGHSASSVAHAVTQAGVPATVAMQLAMRDSSSRLFSSAFYRGLVETECVVQAVWEARQAIRGMGPDWGVPALHLAGGPGPLFLLGRARALRAATIPRQSSRESKPAPTTRSNLPAPIDSFVGRKDELRDLIALLRKPLTRCVTLIGAAGTGKTRLAVQVGLAAKAFGYNDVAHVELRDISEPDRILGQIADSLALEISPNHNILHCLLRALDGRRTLLILDNFEHVRSAASHVRVLLEKLPQLQVLVTSQEPLSIRGELKIDIEPLNVPAVGAAYNEIKACDSVLLLGERAKRANNRFKLVAGNAQEAGALCRALDGLPLGIEIVAAQIRERPLARVLSDMRTEILDTKSRMEGPPAQQTLRAVFNWSFERLAETERALLMQLSLFETAFSEDDARGVCTVASITAGLQSLRDQSLLHCDLANVGRPYRLLVPVRECAAAHLGRPGGEVRRRFIAAFTLRAQRLRETYFAKQMERGTLEGFRRDLENFRSAWRLSVESGQNEPIAELGLAVVSFAPMLLGRSNFDDWMVPLERALLGLARDARLAHLYNVRARLASLRGDFALALSWQQEALTFLSGAADIALRADALSTLAWFTMHAGEYEAAERHAKSAIPQARACGHVEAEAVAFCVLARSSMGKDIRQAEIYANSSLELFRQAQVVRGEAHAIMALGAIAELNGDPTGAGYHYMEAARLCWDQRDEIHTLQCLEALARLQTGHNPGPFATRLLKDVAHLMRIIGPPETVRRTSPEQHIPVDIDCSQTVADVVKYVLIEPNT